MMHWNLICATAPLPVLAHCWEGHEHTGLTLVQWLLVGGGAAVLVGSLTALLVYRVRWCRRRSEQAQTPGGHAEPPDAD